MPSLTTCSRTERKQLVPPRGYDLNVDNFVGFLKSGVEAYNAQK